MRTTLVHSLSQVIWGSFKIRGRVRQHWLSRFRPSVFGGHHLVHGVTIHEYKCLPVHHLASVLVRHAPFDCRALGRKFVFLWRFFPTAHEAWNHEYYILPLIVTLKGRSTHALFIPQLCVNYVSVSVSAVVHFNTHISGITGYFCRATTSHY